MVKINWNKRPRYIPGIISLIVLPFLFIHFARNYYRTLNINAIQIYWTDYDLIERNPEFFKTYRGHYPPERDYTIIKLTGDTKSDKIKLNYAQLEIRDLLATGDTSKGVHFIFGEESGYWSFIKAVDICRVEKARIYMPHENNLWLYNLPEAEPDTTQKITPIYCGTTANMKKFIVKPSGWIVTKKEITSIFHSSWHIIIGFIIFAFFLLKSITKYDA